MSMPNGSIDTIYEELGLSPAELQNFLYGLSLDDESPLAENFRYAAWKYSTPLIPSLQNLGLLDNTSADSTELLSQRGLDMLEQLDARLKEPCALKKINEPTPSAP